MTIAYCLAPFETVSTPHGNALGSRSLIYTLGAVGVVNTSHIIPEFGVKSWCFSKINVPDSVLATINADPTIIVLPFTPAERGKQLGQLTLPARNAIVAALESRGIPTDTFGLSTNFGEILRSCFWTLTATQRLRDLFPETNLDATWGSLPALMRDAILADLSRGRVPVTFTQSTLIREVIRAMWQYAEPLAILPFEDASFSDTFDGTLAAWTQVNGTWSITSSTLRQADASAHRSIVYGTAMDTNDNFSQCTGRTTGSTIGVGPSVRADTGAVTQYCWKGYGADFVYMTYVNAGVENLLATGGAMSGAAEVVLRCEVRGPNLQGYIAGVANAGATHYTLTTGRTGIGCFGILNSANDYADTWSAQDLVAPRVLSDYSKFPKTKLAEISKPVFHVRP